MSSQLIQALVWLAAFAGLTVSAWSDVKSRVIPNATVGVVAVSGICLSLIQRPDQFWFDLILFMLILTGLGVTAHFGVMGGGDVKLIAAASLLFPPAATGQLLIWITLAGGVLSIVYIIARAVLRGRLRYETVSPQAALEQDVEPGRWLAAECSRIAAGGPMPYGVAIFAGVIATKAGGLYTCLHASFC